MLKIEIDQAEYVDELKLLLGYLSSDEDPKDKAAELGRIINELELLGEE